MLVPTRELASQVQAVLAPLARAVGLSVATVFGGVPQNPQVAARRARTDIIVACPGLLADLIEQGHCHLGDVEVSVLDEADHMADLGFLPVVRLLLDMTPPDAQRMLFSATLDKDVDVLVRRFMTDPAEHSIGCRGARRDHPPSADHAPADRAAVVAVLTSGSGRAAAGLHPDQARRASARPPADATPAYPPANCTATSRRVPATGTSRCSPPVRYG